MVIHLSVGGGQAPIRGCHRWQAAATSTGASPTHPQTLLSCKFYSLQCPAWLCDVFHPDVHHNLLSDMFHTLDLLRVQWHKVIESTQSCFYYSITDSVQLVSQFSLWLLITINAHTTHTPHVAHAAIIIWQSVTSSPWHHRYVQVEDRGRYCIWIGYIKYIHSIWNTVFLKLVFLLQNWVFLKCSTFKKNYFEI